MNSDFLIHTCGFQNVLVLSVKETVAYIGVDVYMLLSWAHSPKIQRDCYFCYIVTESSKDIPLFKMLTVSGCYPQDVRKDEFHKQRFITHYLWWVNFSQTMLWEYSYVEQRTFVHRYLLWAKAVCAEKANLYTSQLSSPLKTKCYPSMMEGVQCNQSVHEQAG